MNETPRNESPEDVRRFVVDALEDARDGVLEDERLQRLQALLLESEEARRVYLEFNDLTRLLTASDGDAPATSAETSVTTPAHNEETTERTRRRSRRAWAIGLIAVCVILLSVFAGWNLPRRARFATLVDSKNGAWTRNTQPSEIGTRLGRGRMEIAAGIVTLEFDHGVEVVLEGPADFELLASDRCRLHSGTVVATARPGGEGFVVETPDGDVLDLGTSFGVKAGNGTTEVVVFSGLVDVSTRKGKPETGRLEAGQQVEITDAGLGEIVVVDDHVPDVELPENAPETLQITTTSGRGRDNWAQRGDVERNKRPQDVLLVNRTRGGGYRRWERIAVVQFDVRNVNFDDVEEATFVLQATPTGMGYASRIGNANFSVHKVTDDELDGWKGKGNRWWQGPWGPGNQTPDPERTRFVGRFALAEGEVGTVTVGGADLLDSMRFDENGVITFLVVRDTKPKEIGGLVHGFASSRHPTLRPPTLNFVMAPDAADVPAPAD